MKIKSNLLKILSSVILSFGLLTLGLWLNKFIVEVPYSYIIFSILKAITLLLSAILFLISSYLIYKSEKYKIVTNFTIFCVSTIFLFIVLESVFTFKVESTNVFTDMSNKIWMKRYFNPINSLGYRDEEPKNEPGKSNILVIGDSFVAGHGIKTNEMFTNILKNEIKSDYNIFNLGVCGSHTDREFDSLLSYPVKPDIIILGYYHNDIESAMIKFGIKPQFSNPKDNISSFSKLIIDNSLFANFIFSSYAKKQLSSQYMESEQNDLLIYLDDKIWDYQKSSLDKFYTYCDENDTRLIIIFFPAMSDGIAFSNALAGKKLETYCVDRDIEFINIYPFIKDIPINKRIASKYDNHPSAEINKIISEQILKKLHKK